MKVLLINGSPREHGNTYTALHEMVKIFEGENIETEIVHIGEAEQDAEGLQGMRTLARNMTFLMKSIALGKEQFGLPEKEERIATHFIR